MFGSNKVNRMIVIVIGVLDDNKYEGSELMKEVIRRNCKIDNRLVSQMVYRDRDYDDGMHKRCDYHVEFEAYSMGGIVRDFELLKKAGVIKHVKQIDKYIVF